MNSPGLRPLGLVGGNGYPSLPEPSLVNSSVDLISFLKAIPEARMRRGVSFPQWHLLLVAVLVIMSGCQSLRDLERFALRHHAALNQALGHELERPPTNFTFRYLFLQVGVAEICRQLQVWMLAKIPDGATGLVQLVCDGKTLRGSIVATDGGGRGFISQVSPSPRLSMRRLPRPYSTPARTTSARFCGSCSPPWIWKAT